MGSLVGRLYGQFAKYECPCEGVCGFTSFTSENKTRPQSYLNSIFYKCKMFTSQNTFLFSIYFFVSVKIS